MDSISSPSDFSLALRNALRAIGAELTESDIRPVAQVFLAGSRGLGVPQSERRLAWIKNPVVGSSAFVLMLAKANEVRFLFTFSTGEAVLRFLEAPLSPDESNDEVLRQMKVHFRPQPVEWVSASMDVAIRWSAVDPALSSE